MLHRLLSRSELDVNQSRFKSHISMNSDLTLNCIFELLSQRAGNSKWGSITIGIGCTEIYIQRQIYCQIGLGNKSQNGHRELVFYVYSNTTTLKYAIGTKKHCNHQYHCLCHWYIYIYWQVSESINTSVSEVFNANIHKIMFWKKTSYIYAQTSDHSGILIQRGVEMSGCGLDCKFPDS